MHLVTEAFTRASIPKALVALPCRHFDVYENEPSFSAAAGAAADWFTKYL